MRTSLTSWALVIALFGCSSVEVTTSGGDEGGAGGAIGSGGATSIGGDGGAGPATACASDWAVEFGPVDTFANRHSLAVTSDCATYVVGRFGGALTLGGTTLDSAGPTGWFLFKLDSTGQPLWSKSLGEDGFYGNPVLAATPGGGVALSGTLRGAVDFGDGSVSSADNSPFLAVYDPDGELAFERVFDATATYVEVRSVAVAPDGDVLVAGSLSGGLILDDTELEAPSDGRGLIGRFAADGELRWAKLVDASYLLPVVVDDEGDAFIGSPEFIAKLDRDGNALWQRPFIGDAGYVNDLAIGFNGEIAVAGAFSGEVDLGFGLVGSGAPNGDAEGYVLVLDASDGAPRFARTWVDPDTWNAVVATALRPNGDVLVFGEDRAFWHAVFLEELAPTGETLTHQTFTVLCSSSTVCDTSATGMRLDGSGNVLISGEFWGTLYFGGEPYESGDEDHMFVAGLSKITQDPE